MTRAKTGSPAWEDRVIKLVENSCAYIEHLADPKFNDVEATPETIERFKRLQRFLSCIQFDLKNGTTLSLMENYMAEQCAKMHSNVICVVDFERIGDEDY